MDSYSRLTGSLQKILCLAIALTVFNTYSQVQNVSLVNGNPVFKQALYRLTGVNGLGVDFKISYGGGSYDAIDKSNREVKATPLGTGWSYEFGSILCKSNQTAGLDDDLYFCRLPAGGSVSMKEVENDDGESLLVMYGKPRWRVKRYTRDLESGGVKIIGWKVTDPEGKAYYYGDFKGKSFQDSTFNEMIHKSNSSVKTISVKGMVNSNIAEMCDSSEIDEYPFSWKISAIRSVHGNSIFFKYITEDTRVASKHQDLTYTREIHIDSIITQDGAYLSFEYGDMSEDEYVDYHTLEPEPDGMLEFYNTKYLDKVKAYNALGNITREFKVCYKMLDAGRKNIETLKRVLFKVIEKDRNNQDIGDLTFKYFDEIDVEEAEDKDTDVPYGGLKSVRNSTCGEVLFEYENKEVDEPDMRSEDLGAVEDDILKGSGTVTRSDGKEGYYALYISGADTDNDEHFFEWQTDDHPRGNSSIRIYTMINGKKSEKYMVLPFPEYVYDNRIMVEVSCVKNRIALSAQVPWGTTSLSIIEWNGRSWEKEVLDVYGEDDKYKASVKVFQGEDYIILQGKDEKEYATEHLDDDRTIYDNDRYWLLTKKDGEWEYTKEYCRPDFDNDSKDKNNELRFYPGKDFFVVNGGYRYRKFEVLKLCDSISDSDTLKVWKNIEDESLRTGIRDDGGMQKDRSVAIGNGFIVFSYGKRCERIVIYHIKGDELVKTKTSTELDSGLRKEVVAGKDYVAVQKGFCGRDLDIFNWTGSKWEETFHEEDVFDHGTRSENKLFSGPDYIVKTGDWHGDRSKFYNWDGESWDKTGEFGHWHKHSYRDKEVIDVTCGKNLCFDRQDPGNGGLINGYTYDGNKWKRQLTHYKIGNWKERFDYSQLTFFGLFDLGSLKDWHIKPRYVNIVGNYAIFGTYPINVDSYSYFSALTWLFGLINANTSYIKHSVTMCDPDAGVIFEKPKRYVVKKKIVKDIEGAIDSTEIEYPEAVCDIISEKMVTDSCVVKNDFVRSEIKFNRMQPWKSGNISSIKNTAVDTNGNEKGLSLKENYYEDHQEERSVIYANGVKKEKILYGLGLGYYKENQGYITDIDEDSTLPNVTSESRVYYDKNHSSVSKGEKIEIDQGLKELGLTKIPSKRIEFFERDGTEQKRITDYNWEYTDSNNDGDFYDPGDRMFLKESVTYTVRGSDTSDIRKSDSTIRVSPQGIPVVTADPYGLKSSTLLNDEGTLKYADVVNAGLDEVAVLPNETRLDGSLPLGWSELPGSSIELIRVQEATAFPFEYTYMAEQGEGVENTISPADPDLSQDMVLSYWIKAYNGSSSRVQFRLSRDNGTEEERFRYVSDSLWSKDTLMFERGGVNTVTIRSDSGDILIGEIRVFPEDASVTTYVYDSYFREKRASIGSNNNVGNITEYNSRGSVSAVKSNRNVVLKEFQYNNMDCCRNDHTAKLRKLDIRDIEFDEEEYEYHVYLSEPDTIEYIAEAASDEAFVYVDGENEDTDCPCGVRGELSVNSYRKVDFKVVSASGRESNTYEVNFYVFDNCWENFKGLKGEVSESKRLKRENGFYTNAFVLNTYDSSLVYKKQGLNFTCISNTYEFLDSLGGWYSVNRDFEKSIKTDGKYTYLLGSGLPDTADPDSEWRDVMMVYYKGDSGYKYMIKEFDEDKSGPSWDVTYNRGYGCFAVSFDNAPPEVYMVTEGGEHGVEAEHAFREYDFGISADITGVNFFRDYSGGSTYLEIETEMANGKKHSSLYSIEIESSPDKQLLSRKEGNIDTENSVVLTHDSIQYIYYLSEEENDNGIDYIALYRTDIHSDTGSEKVSESIPLGDNLKTGADLFYRDSKFYVAFSSVYNNNRITSLELEFDPGDSLNVPLRFTPLGDIRGTSEDCRLVDNSFNYDAYNGIESFGYEYQNQDDEMDIKTYTTPCENLYLEALGVRDNVSDEEIMMLPEFKPYISNYKLTADYRVNGVNFSPVVPNTDDALVTVNDKEVTADTLFNLEPGENEFRIMVFNRDTTKGQIYSVNIFKRESMDPGICSIELYRDKDTTRQIPLAWADTSGLYGFDTEVSEYTVDSSSTLMDSVYLIVRGNGTGYIQVNGHTVSDGEISKISLDDALENQLYVSAHGDETSVGYTVTLFTGYNASKYGNPMLMVRGQNSSVILNDNIANIAGGMYRVSDNVDLAEVSAYNLNDSAFYSINSLVIPDDETPREIPLRYGYNSMVFRIHNDSADGRFPFTILKTGQDRGADDISVTYNENQENRIDFHRDSLGYQCKMTSDINKVTISGSVDNGEGKHIEIAEDLESLYARDYMGIDIDTLQLFNGGKSNTSGLDSLFPSINRSVKRYYIVRDNSYDSLTFSLSGRVKGVSIKQEPDTDSEISYYVNQGGAFTEVDSVDIYKNYVDSVNGDEPDNFNPSDYYYKEFELSFPNSYDSLDLICETETDQREYRINIMDRSQISEERVLTFPELDEISDMSVVVYSMDNQEPVVYSIGLRDVIETQEIADTVAWEKLEYEVDEGESINLKINSGRINPEPYEVEYSLVNKGGLTDEEYTLKPEEIMVDKCTGKGLITFNSLDDRVYERGESLEIELTGGSGEIYDVAGNSVATVNIKDNDAPVVEFVESEDIVVEEDAGELRIPVIKHCPEEVSASISVYPDETSSGFVKGLDAVLDTDVVEFSETPEETQDIVIDIADDDIPESSEAFVVEISSVEGYKVFGESRRVVIKENDQDLRVIGFSTDSRSVIEAERDLFLDIEIAQDRTFESLTDVVVELDNSSSAVFGEDEDFFIQGMKDRRLNLSFASTQNKKRLEVHINFNEYNPGDRVIKLNILESSGYTVGGSGSAPYGSVEINIIDSLKINPLIYVDMSQSKDYSVLNAESWIDDDYPEEIQDGKSWETAFKYLRDAVELANQINGDASNGINVSGIKIAEGVYYPDEFHDENGDFVDSDDSTKRFSMNYGMDLEGGYPEGGAMAPDPEEYQTVLSGEVQQDGDIGNNIGICHVYNTGKNQIFFRGIVFREGKAFSGQSVYGGAIRVSDSETDAVINNCVFNSNYSSVLGGAIGFSGGDLVIKNSEFNDNTACAVGGAVDFSGNDLTIINSDYINNHGDHPGGAVCFSGRNMSVSGADFNGNTSDATGGAIDFTGNNITIDNSTFIEDTAAFDGGAINFSGNDFTVSNTDYIDNAGSSSGGAVWFDGRNMSVTDVEYVGNASETDGGAVYFIGNDISLDGSVFKNNNTLAQGGGLYFNGRNMSVTDVEYVGNASETYGGAVYFTGNDISLDVSVFKNNNTLDQGGGLYFNGRDMSIVKTEMSKDTAGYNGGAVYHSGESIEIVKSKFLNNHAGDNGGGLYTDDSIASAYIESAVFDSNSGLSGGACYLKYKGDSDTLNIVNSVFARNRAVGHLWDSQGGAVYFEISSLTKDESITITNSTFFDNYAQAGEYSGGAIYMNEMRTRPTWSIINGNIFNTLFWENEPDIFPYEETFMMNSCSEADPEFIDEDNPKGSDGLWCTDDDGFILDKNAPSPCLDAGDESYIDLEYDIKERPRVIGEGIDIGAYETP